MEPDYKSEERTPYIPPVMSTRHKAMNHLVKIVGTSNKAFRQDIKRIRSA